MMKKRNGFVSNSSSSSFVVFREDISYEQEMLILDPMSAIPLLRDIYLKEVFEEDQEDYTFESWLENVCSYINPEDVADWHVSITSRTIEGDTIIDNFDYPGYLDKLGIKHISRSY